MTNRTCPICEASIERRPPRAIYCSKSCATKASHLRDPSLRKKHQARYRASAKGKAAKRRYLKPRTCIACGDTWLTENTRGKYCSLLCRDFDKWGPRSSPWPRVQRGPAKPKPAPFIPEPRDCGWCGGQFLAEHRTTVYCCFAHKKRAGRARRRAREAGADGTYTWAELTRKWIDIGKCCAYCNQPKRNDQIEPDHVIPLSKGGSNSIHNIVPACQPCNGDKRDLSLTDWYVDRERRGLEPRALSHMVTHLSVISPAA